MLIFAPKQLLTKPGKEVNLQGRQKAIPFIASRYEVTTMDTTAIHVSTELYQQAAMYARQHHTSDRFETEMQEKLK